MKRLRVQNSQTMDGRLFVQFVALIYINAIREKINSKKELENYTVREALEEMDILTKITYSGIQDIEWLDVKKLYSIAKKTCKKKGTVLGSIQVCIRESKDNPNTFQGIPGEKL